MARQEHDREDLLAEATALVERVELAVPHFEQPVVLGVRRDGCLSIYFGADPAYHFNTRHELRRAFIDDRIVKAEQGQLVSLTRSRTDGEVALIRHEFSDAEQLAMLQTASERIRALHDSAASLQCRILRQVPETLPAIERIIAWLAPLRGTLSIAPSPNAR